MNIAIHHGSAYVLFPLHIEINGPDLIGPDPSSPAAFSVSKPNSAFLHQPSMAVLSSVRASCRNQGCKQCKQMLLREADSIVTIDGR
jgi:hypothetical protein